MCFIVNDYSLNNFYAKYFSKCDSIDFATCVLKLISTEVLDSSKKSKPCADPRGLRVKRLSVLSAKRRRRLEEA